MYNNKHKDFIKYNFKGDPNGNFFLSQKKDEMERLFDCRKNIFNPDVKNINSKDLFRLESLDYYIADEIKNAADKKYVDEYLSLLKKEVLEEPAKYFSSPVFCEDNLFKKGYYSASDAEEIRNAVNDYGEKQIEKYEKFQREPESCSSDEINELANFFAHAIKTNKADSGAKKLFDYMISNNLEIQIESSNFIMEYISKKEMQEKGFCWQLTIADDIREESAAHYDENGGHYIVFNRANLLRKDEKTKTLTITHFTFHEIRHREQNHQLNRGSKEDCAMYYGLINYLHREDQHDYDNYYFTNEIEIDANLYAYEKIGGLLNEYTKDGRIPYLKGVKGGTYAEEFKRAIPYKKREQDKHILPPFLINAEHLENYFKKNQRSLEYRSQFQDYFHMDGTAKTLLEILKNPDVNQNSMFFADMVSARKYKEPVASLNIGGLTTEERIIIEENLAGYAKTITSKIASTSKVIDAGYRDKVFYENIIATRINPDSDNNYKVIPRHMSDRVNSVGYVSALTQKLIDSKNGYANNSTLSLVGGISDCVEKINQSLSTIEKRNPELTKMVVREHLQVPNYMMKEDIQNVGTSTQSRAI